MHAAYLARLLGIPKVLVPNSPGILSAIGMLMADIIKDYSLTVMRNQFTTGWEKLSQLFLSLETKGRDDLIDEGIDEKGIILEQFLDMRYAGQSYEIIVPFTDDYIEGFHALHEKKYGYRNRIQGPAILVEYSSTIVVPPFAEALVDAYGNLMMEIR